MSKRISYIILGFLLIAAFTIRIWNVGDKGLFLYDEADIMLRVRTFTTLPQVVTGVWQAVFGGNSEGLKEFSYDVFSSGFFPSMSALPGHIVPGVVISLLFGDHDWTLVLWNIVLGVCSVFVAFRLARTITGSETSALVAAGFTAFSPFQVLYDRTALAQPDAGFWILLTMWLYADSMAAEQRVRYRWLFGSGLSFAMAVSAHYGVLMVLPAFALIEFAVALLFYRAQMWGRWGVLAAGMVMPLSFWQAVLLLRDKALASFHYVGGLSGGYVGELGDMLFTRVSDGTFELPRVGDYAYYVEILSYFHGAAFVWILAVALILGIILILRIDISAVHAPDKARNISLAVVLCIWCLVNLELVFHGFRVPRAYLVILPLTMVVASIPFGFFTSPWTKSMKNGLRRSGLVGGIIFAVLLMALWFPRIREILYLRSPYPVAAEEVKALIRAGREVVATPWVMFQYYTRERMVTLAQFQQERPFIYVGDWTKLIYDEENNFENSHVPYRTDPNGLANEPALVREVYPFMSKEEIKDFIRSERRLYSTRWYEVR